MKPIIRVKNLSKHYQIGRQKEAYGTLRESLIRAARAPFDRVKRVWSNATDGLDPRENGNGIWALRDVSFEVYPGEVLGIIGRNGAGKSTLLKILSRITDPTTGQVDLYGRVGSLLEVGTGFHPELTGRENIYLNGAILGMGRREISRKINEIVDFAGVEQFLDTPVKHYSSGMHLRLAFAVAAHMESDVLVVDEVLAVGDASFQEKCLGKIGDVTKSGRTVLFVSHNEGIVRHLCTRCILISGGKIALDGDPAAAYALYRRNRDETTFSSAHRRHDTGHVHILDARLMVDGESVSDVESGEQLDIVFEFEVHSAVPCAPAILIRDENGAPVIFSWLASELGGPGCPPPGRYRNSYRLDLPKLATGSYSIDMMLAQVGIGFHHYLEESLVFRVHSAVHAETGWNFQQSYGFGRILVNASKLYGPQHVDINNAEN